MSDHLPDDFFPDPATDLDHLDPLAAWRQVTPSQASDAEADAVRAAVLARVGLSLAPDDADARDALRRAGRDGGPAWRALGQRVYAVRTSRSVALSRRADLRGSLAWLALREGDRPARLPLLRSLAIATRRAPDEAPEPDATRCLLSLLAEMYEDGLWTDEQIAAAVGMVAPPRRDPDAVLAELLDGAPPAAPVGASRLAPLVRVAGAAIPEGKQHDRWRPLERGLPAPAWPDPDRLAAQLLAEFPWAEDVVERIRADLSLGWRIAGRAERLPPLCIVGPPGCGKSRFVVRLGALLAAAGGPRLSLLPVAGCSDNRFLAGTARGWGSASPSWPADAMVTGGCANPVLALDELDKAGGSDTNGDLRRTLLTMAEPTTAGAWLDECLGAPLDLRRVTWIATANDWHRVDPLLRTRWRRVDMPPARPQDYGALERGILADLASEHGADVAALPELDQQARAALRDRFASGRLSARGLARLVRRALEASAAAEMGAPRQ